MNLFFLKKTRLTKFLFFVLADILLICLAFYLAFLLRFDGAFPIEYISNGVFQKIIIWALFFCLPLFYFFGLYSFSWSYVSTQELVSLFKALTFGFLFFGVTVFLSKDFPFFVGFPRSVFIISYLLIYIFCGALRFSKRIYLNRGGIFKKHEGETLIVGASDPAEQLIRSIIYSGTKFYSPVGLVDNNPIKKGVSIHGLRVLGKIDDIPEIVNVYNIKQIIVALSSKENKLIKKSVDLARKSGVNKIKIIPTLSNITGGKASFKNLKNVEAEDLLGREEVSLELKQIEKSINGRVVLITGAAGSIGSELARQVIKFKPSLIVLLDQDETGIFNISREIEESFPGQKIQSFVCDVTDKQKIKKILNSIKPNIIFHAAAYKHVPLMENDPEEAIKNNIFGTKNLAEEAVSAGVEKFILISTDKAVNPTSVMGATKRVCELICQSLNQSGKTKFISVRFGNVLDSRGSVIPIFREQIKKGGPVQVTHPDMKRYFMLTSEACLLVLQAGAMGEGGEIFVLDMGKPIKILDLAREMIKLSGFEPDKDIAIVFIGMRPGEKMFEDIMTAEEGVSATKNQRIFIAKQANYNNEDLDNNLAKLEALVLEDQKKESAEFLKNICNISNKK